jgi:DNA-3-methyladenine glycosylase I
MANASEERQNAGAGATARCPWCGTDPLYVAYHDTEWGVPCHDERTLFEFLILEGAQAGLSWITILRKRENYRRAYDNFDAAQALPATARRTWRACWATPASSATG